MWFVRWSPKKAKIRLTSFWIGMVNLRRILSEELPKGIVPTDDGQVRTLPDMLADKGNIDGFFIARMRRKS